VTDRSKNPYNFLCSQLALEMNGKNSEKEGFACFALTWEQKANWDVRQKALQLWPIFSKVFAAVGHEKEKHRKRPFPTQRQQWQPKR